MVDVKNLTDAELEVLVKECEEEKRNRMARIKYDKWATLCHAWTEYRAVCGPISCCDLEGEEIGSAIIRQSRPGQITAE